ncbi:hypothetical protein CAEBREN_30246 [Caenorhabditis brenneri]|uniref:Uncharacterized protein n=1 Tax=Caenorhabditis brenneri TaxID=135651 RepID=G0M6Q5_CAEBE|nr:hypothetical protein CAEBREN_30246 [Caenorhabditis brenneri]
MCLRTPQRPIRRN